MTAAAVLLFLCACREGRPSSDGDSEEDLFIWREYQGQKTVRGLTEKGKQCSEITIPASAADIFVDAGSGDYPNVKILRFAGPETKAEKAGCLDGFSALEEIYYPAAASRLPISLNHSCVRKVVLPESLKELKANLFSGWESLTEIELNDGLEVIGREAFAHTKSFDSIEIPSSVRVLEKRAFYGCEGLNGSGMVLPEGLSEIGEQVFWGTGLSEIRLPSTLKSIGAGGLQTAGGLRAEDCMIYVKEGSWADLHFDSYSLAGQEKRYY